VFILYLLWSPKTSSLWIFPKLSKLSPRFWTFWSGLAKLEAGAAGSRHPWFSYRPTALPSRSLPTGAKPIFIHCIEFQAAPFTPAHTDCRYGFLEHRCGYRIERFSNLQPVFFGGFLGLCGLQFEGGNGKGIGIGRIGTRIRSETTTSVARTLFGIHFDFGLYAQSVLGGLFLDLTPRYITPAPQTTLALSRSRPFAKDGGQVGG